MLDSPRSRPKPRDGIDESCKRARRARLIWESTAASASGASTGLRHVTGPRRGLAHVPAQLDGPSFLMARSMAVLF